MGGFIYTVWFRDTATDPLDQDYEWNACLSIHAETAGAAQTWGDFLAKKRSSLSPDIFLYSTIAVDEGVSELPVVNFGQEISDEFAGW